MLYAGARLLRIGWLAVSVSAGIEIVGMGPHASFGGTGFVFDVPIPFTVGGDRVSLSD